MEVTIEAQIVPFAQARHREFKGGTYDPTAKKKKALFYLIKNQWNKDLIDGPCRLFLEFGMPIPKSMSKKKRTALVGQPHIKKPDIDNLEKAVLDSMSGAVLRDDCIVWWVEKKKFYVEQPFIRINLLTAQ